VGDGPRSNGGGNFLQNSKTGGPRTKLDPVKVLWRMHRVVRRGPIPVYENRVMGGQKRNLWKTGQTGPGGVV